MHNVSCITQVGPNVGDAVESYAIVRWLKSPIFISPVKCLQLTRIIEQLLRLRHDRRWHQSWYPSGSYEDLHHRRMNKHMQSGNRDGRAWRTESGRRDLNGMLGEKLEMGSKGSFQGRFARCAQVRTGSGSSSVCMATNTLWFCRSWRLSSHQRYFLREGKSRDACCSQWFCKILAGGWGQFLREVNSRRQDWCRTKLKNKLKETESLWKI